MIKYLLSIQVLLVLLCCAVTVNAQRRNPVGTFTDRAGSIGRGTQVGGDSNDSLQRRDKNADSITITYKFLDSTRTYRLDSSVNDFSKRFPIPADYVYLGNPGTAARSILFSPVFRPGWDPGFHSFDIYRWTVEKARFFSTTRPYSELNYMLASKGEQQIELLHTQNIKPNWNMLGQYRLIAAPGFFNGQKTSHSSYLFTSWYQSVNKRYNNYFVIASNKISASENGGLIDTMDYLRSPEYTDRFTIPTKIGGDNEYSSNFFTTNIRTGNQYTDFNVMMRQQYDFGRKDSLVTDSTVIPLFFPKVRFEHTIRYTTNKYLYQDLIGDSAYYKDFYDITLAQATDTFEIREYWKVLTNDFSIYQFPEEKNLHQYIKVGASHQQITGRFTSGKNSFFNIIGHGEYRNRTRNQKWDIAASGEIYFAGLNAGDFRVSAALERLLGQKLGYLKIGFENANRTPSFIFDTRSSFYLAQAATFKKENNTQIYAAYSLPKLRLQLSGHYYLATNYTYYTGFYQPNQATALFNVLQVAARKTFKFGRKKQFNLHSDVYVQQVIGNGPVNVPLVFTRNRLAYEGNLGFKNLDIALGLESRYYTPYKADNYSPVLGRFQYQDTATIRNNVPDIAAYVHFRIRSFKAFVRAENLNTMSFSNGFGFTNNNLAATGYPYPGFLFRLGIYWGFVN